MTGDLDDRLFAVGMDVLKTMEGFLVVADEAKAEAARAALRGGFAARLVLDDRLAERLLALG